MHYRDLSSEITLAAYKYMFANINSLTGRMARNTANAHIISTSFTARDSLDIVCDKNGLQIATYLKSDKKR